jgi:hypothetical protein
LLSLGVTILVTVALAQQPKKPSGKPASKPKAGPTSVLDGGSAGNEAFDETPSSAAPAPGDGGAAAQPDLHEISGDAGQKPSPLNPQPNELAGAPPQTQTSTVDYDKLLAEIASLRARVAAVSDSLFHSRLAVALANDADHARIARLVVSLDDGVVYTAPSTFRGDDMTTLYDHAVAPGRHAITIDVDRVDDHDQAFRTGQRSRFIVDVPKDQRLSVEVRILDDSTMGADFSADRSGKYDLRVRVKATAQQAGK